MSRSPDTLRLYSRITPEEQRKTVKLAILAALLTCVLSVTDGDCNNDVVDYTSEVSDDVDDVISKK